MLVSLRSVSRRYAHGEREVHALRDVTLTIPENRFVSITGPSGCGKSTLLHLLACLDQPSQGEITVAGRDLHKASERERTAYRRQEVGIVFQFFNLMPTMTVMENVTLPLLLSGGNRVEAMAAAEAMLDRVDLGQRREHFIHQLSGGEMQRTAIARALVHKPKLLLADEPTGNLDSENTQRILAVLRGIHEDKLTTLVLVTHSEEVARAAEQEIRMADGRVTKC